MPPSTPPRPVVFITGASSGIGAACVARFAAQGWDVAATARRLDRLGEVAREASARNPAARIQPLACDVCEDRSVEEAFRETKRLFGRLDALINNAGYGVYGTVAETPLARFRENMETNYFGVLRCTQAALPFLRQAAAESPRRWGAAIVMVSSFVGRRALPAMGAYCATKFALEALSESLRVELSEQRISVSVINPGVTQTDFFSTAQGRRPDGYIHPRQGMTSQDVAGVIFRATRRPRRNAYLTAAGKAGICLQYLSPRLFDAALRKTWQGRKTKAKP